jgi:asparagine N-glycosylation enzyme membrane subunit Stt3
MAVIPFSGVNETLSKYLAIGILLGLIAGVIAYALTNQVLLIEAGLAAGIILGAAVGYLLSNKKK